MYMSICTQNVLLLYSFGGRGNNWKNKCWFLCLGTILQSHLHGRSQAHDEMIIACFSFVDIVVMQDRRQAVYCWTKKQACFHILYNAHTEQLAFILSCVGEGAAEIISDATLSSSSDFKSISLNQNILKQWIRQAFPSGHYTNQRNTWYILTLDAIYKKV